MLKSPATIDQDNTAFPSPAPCVATRKRPSTKTVAGGNGTGNSPDKKVFNGFQGPAYPPCLPPDLFD